MDKQALEIRARQWYEIVLEANNSPLSKKAWCRQNNISSKSFYYWQRKFRLAEAEKMKDITPSETSNHEGRKKVILPQAPSAGSGLCSIEDMIQIRPGGAGIIPELIMQKGAYHILIGRGVSEDTLITVLRAIDHA